MTALLDYLTDDTLPAEAKKAQAIKIKSRQYAVIGGVLYQNLFLEPWLRCVGPLQAEYVVKEIHEGSCREIISNNGKQFRENPFKDWLDQGSKDWVEEVPHVMWAHRNMIKTSNEDTPFSLTYSTKAVIPVEIGMPLLRCAEVDQVRNYEALMLNLDMLEEKRERAAIREAKRKAKMEKYYNAKVRNTTFKPGDFVYRSNEASHAKEGGKLGPKWEGPYEVVEALGKGAYKLKNRNGDILPQT
ncbi:reverse transcriptase domain-containing protein [Tanacetum coccineum]